MSFESDKGFEQVNMLVESHGEKVKITIDSNKSTYDSNEEMLK